MSNINQGLQDFNDYNNDSQDSFDTLYSDKPSLESIIATASATPRNVGTAKKTKPAGRR